MRRNEREKRVSRVCDTAREDDAFGHEDFHKAVQTEGKLFAVNGEDLGGDGASRGGGLENRFAV